MNIVIINCFDTYEHRVDLLHNVLTSEGHRVSVMTSNFRHFEKVKRTEPKADYKFFDAKPYRKNLSYQRLSSHRKLSRSIFDYLQKLEDSIDLLWVLVPPNSFVKDAADYKRKHDDTKLIFDLIDLWPETMPIGSIKNVFPFSIWKNLRDDSIRNANIIVTECSLYQEKLKNKLQGIRTETLYLARPLVPYTPNLNLSDEKIALCYLGSINNIVDIDVIADIVREIKKNKPVELHVVGDGERKNELISASEKAGATVIFHGKVYDRDEKQKIFDSCHYGLNIMKETVCVGLTMKSMDYMEFGLPMINNIHGDTWNLIEKEGIGVNITNLGVVSKNYNNLMRSYARSYFENNLTTTQFRIVVDSILEEA